MHFFERVASLSQPLSSIAIMMMMMTTMMPITKGGAGLVRQYSAQYRPGQASVQQRKLFRPQSVLARSETSASETSKVSSFVAPAASELQVRMWWKAGGGREILDGWKTKEGGRKGSGEIPEKLQLIFQLCLTIIIIVRTRQVHCGSCQCIIEDPQSSGEGDFWGIIVGTFQIGSQSTFYLYYCFSLL